MGYAKCCMVSEHLHTNSEVFHSLPQLSMVRKYQPIFSKDFQHKHQSQLLRWLPEPVISFKIGAWAVWKLTILSSLSFNIYTNVKQITDRPGKMSQYCFCSPFQMLLSESSASPDLLLIPSCSQVWAGIRTTWRFIAALIVGPTPWVLGFRKSCLWYYTTISRVSIAGIKQHEQKQLGDERVYLAYTFTPQSITEGSQGRNSDWAGTWRQESMKKL